MRNVITPQMQIGQTAIADIFIDVSSRDDIPMILLGLQHIYKQIPLRQAVFKILAEVIPFKNDDLAEQGIPVAADKGRPGMDQWSILVLGTIRLALNADYDRIQELANQHRTLRMMLGHGVFDTEDDYRLQTLKDNLKLFTPEIMGRISAEVIRAGYQLLDLEIDAIIRGRCDSFVLKTNVHFPTDINLLYDAIRVLIRDCVKWSENHSLPGWRQHRHNLSQFKKLYRKIQKLRHSTSKDEDKKQAQAEKIKTLHQDYIDLAQAYLVRITESYDILKGPYQVPEILLSDLNTFIQHAIRQIEQIKRRVIDGEKISHHEKVFSLFEPHTEWISKGKAGVPVELGLRVCIMEDTHGFLLHHQVMENQTDDKIAVAMVETTQALFPTFNGCSFDKGFHSQENQRELKNRLDQVVLPKKGKLNGQEKEREYADEFVQMKKQHSAVESAINALEVHGLDVCRDKGIDAFKRYTALAVLSRNIQILGTLVRNQERERLALLKEAA
jgi:hypothetical protein